MKYFIFEIHVIVQGKTEVSCIVVQADSFAKASAHAKKLFPNCYDLVWIHDYRIDDIFVAE